MVQVEVITYTVIMPRVPHTASFSVPQHASRVMRFSARATKAVVTVAGVGALGLGGVVVASVLQVQYATVRHCATCLVLHVNSRLIILQVKRVRKLPEQVVLSMDLTDTQISETADFDESSLHLPKASTVPQQQ